MQIDRVTPEERGWLLEHLKTVHVAMNEVVSQISPVQWNRRGSIEAWSPREIVEHTVMVDEEILGDVQDHWKDEPIPDWENVVGRKDLMLKRYLPNIGRARASTKTSTFRGFRQEDVCESFQKSYDAVARLLDRGSDTPLKAIIWAHGGMGALSAYQWLLYIPLHTERHLNQLLRLAQIAEQVEWADPKHRWESVRA